MVFLDKLKRILHNLREKPEEERRAILQISIVFVSIIFAVVWLGISYRALNNLTRDKLKSQLHIEDFKKEFEKNNFGK